MRIDDHIDAWRDRLERAGRDREWTEHWARRTAGRLEAMPQMKRLLDDFLAGTVPLEELRSQYDRKTRKEWDYFGFKGFGGAMFLNMIAKHLPEESAPPLSYTAPLGVRGTDETVGAQETPAPCCGAPWYVPTMRPSSPRGEQCCGIPRLPSCAPRGPDVRSTPSGGSAVRCADDTRRRPRRIEPRR